MRIFTTLFLLLFSTFVFAQSPTYTVGEVYPIDGYFVKDCMKYDNVFLADPIFTEKGLIMDNINWVYTVEYLSEQSGDCKLKDVSYSSAYTFSIPTSSNIQDCTLLLTVRAYKDSVFLGEGFFTPEFCSNLTAKK